MSWGPILIVFLSLLSPESLWAGLGRELPKHELFAHMCLLDMNPESKSYNNICSGILIDSNHILTAAHCFDQAHPQEVTCGPKQRKVSFSPDRVWIHPEYKKGQIIQNVSYVINDLALISLDEPLASPNVERLSLRRALESEGCAFFGFSKLHKVSRQEPRPDHRGWSFSLEALQWMSGSEGLSPLIQVQGLTGQGSLLEVGDSGGPLMCKVQNIWKLVGIASSRDFHYNSIFASALDPEIPWPESSLNNHDLTLSKNKESHWRSQKLIEEHTLQKRKRQRLQRNLGFDPLAEIEFLFQKPKISENPEDFERAAHRLRIWKSMARQKLVELGGPTLLRLKAFSLFYPEAESSEFLGSIGDLSFNFLRVLEQKGDWLQIDLKVNGPSDTFLCLGDLLCDSELLKGVWVKLEDLEIFVYPSQLSFERFILTQKM